MDKQRYIDHAKREYIVDDFKIIYETEDKALYETDTVKYGPVILKLNDNSQEICLEYLALQNMAGDNCVKVYTFLGGEALVEERIIPGNDLNEVLDTDERLLCFVNVFNSIHKLPKNASMYPTYIDWLQKAVEFCVENNVESELTSKMELAREIGVELFDKYPERVLLHGDLHHQNILLKNGGKYIIIDPKGVMGPDIFDVPRFILNELDDDYDESGEEHMLYVISKLSELLGYDEIDIKKLFFMEMMLANIWCIEDGESIEEEAISMAYKLLQSI